MKTTNFRRYFLGIAGGFTFLILLSVILLVVIGQNKTSPLFENIAVPISLAISLLILVLGVGIGLYIAFKGKKAFKFLAILDKP